MTSLSDYLASRPTDPAERKLWLAGLANVAERRARELKLSPGATETGPTEAERDALAGVPKAFARASLNDFPELRVRLGELYLRLTTPPDDVRYPGLLLAGQPGRGKTHLGCALVRAFVRQRRRALFVTARHLQRTIWATFAADGGDERTARAAFTRPDLLVVDDLGHEGARGDASLSLLLDVLDERANDRRPTVVTTNLTGDDVATRFDDAMYSRLAAFDRLVLEGPDRRRQCPGS